MNKLKPTVIARLFTFALFCVAPNFASAQVLFDSIPEPLPGSSPSLGYQATQTAEFGDYIAFAVTDRAVTLVTVTLNSWACQEGAWFLSTCANPDPGNEGYTHPVTLNIYDVDNSGSVPVTGALLFTLTREFLIPWRPDSDPLCGNGYLPDCDNGYNFNIEFDLTGMGLVLPDEVIYGIAYNTQTWGANPIGAPGHYNSLNFAVPADGATMGIDIDDEAVFWNTATAGNYTDGGAAGVGIFRLDTGWTGFVPAVRFEDPDSDGDGVPNSADICPATVADEPIRRLGKNRWIWDGSDWVSNTNRGGPDKNFSMEDTQGCGCTQILDILVELTGSQLNGHYKFGCSSSIVEDWIWALTHL